MRRALRYRRVVGGVTLLASLALALALALALGPGTGSAYIPPTRLIVFGGTVRVSRGSAPVRLSCQKGEAIRLICRGSITIESPPPSGPGPHPNVIVLYGRARFAIPNCCSAPSHVVNVPLDAGARRLLSQGRHVRARVVATLAGSSVSGSALVTLTG